MESLVFVGAPVALIAFGITIGRWWALAIPGVLGDAFAAFAGVVWATDGTSYADDLTGIALFAALIFTLFACAATAAGVALRALVRRRATG